MDIVCAVRENGNSPACEWLEKLQDQDRERFIKLGALFQRMAQVGRVVDDRKFKKLKGDLWEFKSHQHRVGCYRDGGAWVLTHGFVKKQNKWRRSEIEKSISIIEEDRARHATS